MAERCTTAQSIESILDRRPSKIHNLCTVMFILDEVLPSFPQSLHLNILYTYSNLPRVISTVL